MEGDNLQDRLVCRDRGTLVPLTDNERVLVLSDVARGLSYLHSELCVIHRDVKRENVLMDRGSHGRVGDFGIPTSLNDNHSDITTTHVQTENVVGIRCTWCRSINREVLSMKVDSLTFGLIIIETLTGLPVLNPTVCYYNRIKKS